MSERGASKVFGRAALVAACAWATTIGVSQAQVTDPADRLTISVTDDTVKKGSSVWFSGRLVSSTHHCQATRTIKLQMRSGSDPYRTVALPKTADSGRWASKQRVWRTATWRAVASGTDECPRVQSRELKVRVRG